MLNTDILQANSLKDFINKDVKLTYFMFELLFNDGPPVNRFGTGHNDEMQRE